MNNKFYAIDEELVVTIECLNEINETLHSSRLSGLCEKLQLVRNMIRDLKQNKN
jgi:hypothetical protein